MDWFCRPAARVSALLIGGTLALHPGPAEALDPSRRITQYGLDVWLTRDGLPQNSVRALVQTRDGYLWLGTWGGLVRFDGVRFAIFDRANTPALRDSRITALLEGDDGSLWIGTAFGGLVRMKGGRFEAYRSEADTSYEERSRWQIRSLARGRAGALWVGTSGGGFRRFADGRFGPLLMDRLVVRAILEDRSGRLWVATSSGVLELSWLDAAMFRVERRLLPDRLVNGLYEDRDGDIWIAARGGLTRVHGDGVTTFGPAEGFPADAALSICADRDGALWIGTDGGGLVRMRGARFDVLTVLDGLSNDVIPALFEDREGSLWIGSNDGLNQLRDTRFTVVTVREGLTVDAVSSLLPATDGSLWIGTDGGGLNHLRGGEITALTAANGLPSNYAGGLFEAADGAIWISGDGVITRVAGGTLRRYSAADGVPAGFVSAIAQDRDGRIVIKGEGPVRVLADDRFVVYPRQPAGIEYCFSIQRTRDGDLWLATTGGLVRIARDASRVYTTRDGLPDNGVHSVYEDAAGTLWIATVGGLARLSRGTIVNFSKAGPLGEIVFEIVEDERAYLWLNGRQGILKVKRADLDALAADPRPDVPVTVYGQADGLKSTEYNAAYIQRPAARTRDGRLWFATTRGVATIDPAADRINPMPPPLVVEAVVAGGRVETRGPVEIPAGTTAFEIQYTALSLRAPSRVRFSYRLEGLEEGWIDAGSRRAAYYSHVPPGSYRFRLRGANSDGVWNETGAAFEIRVLPYFYQTSAFRASVVGLLIVAGFGLHRLRLRRMERQFALVMKERNRIAREIHDTLAQGLAGIGLHLAAIENDPVAITRDRHVEKARQLVQTNLAEAKRTVWDLHPPYLDRHDFASALSRMAADLREATHIRIAVHSTGVSRRLDPAVERNLFRIAQEAVTNAVRHAGARAIQIEVRFDPHETRVAIADDGHGFEAHGTHEGFGLTSMRERASQIGADLRIERASSGGTTVAIAVPRSAREQGGIAARAAALARAARLRVRRWLS